MTKLSDRDFKVAQILLEEDLTAFLAGGRSMTGAFFERKLGPGGAIRARHALAELRDTTWLKLVETRDANGVHLELVECEAPSHG